jgi:hypothetical protein
VRDQLVERSLVGEYASGIQHATYLPKRFPRSYDVVAGTKVDDDVERAILEGHRSHIGSHDLGSKAPGEDGGSRLTQQIFIEVDRHEPRWTTAFGDHWKPDSAATADLEHLSVPRYMKQPREERDLESPLTPIASPFGRKRLVRHEVWRGRPLTNGC